MTHYSSGVRIERMVISYLNDLGYNAVRSAGSKGPFDVIAWNNRTVRFIQVKSTQSKYNPSKELEKLRGIVVPASVSSELWVYEKGKGWKTCYMVKRVASLEFPSNDVLFYGNDGRMIRVVNIR